MKDKILILAIVLVLVVGAAAALVIASMRQQDLSIDRTLSRWRQKYDLDDQKVDVLRRIELDFHGNGAPFSGKSGRTPEEIHQHHVELSKVMGAENGSRFLKHMEKNQAQH